MQRAQVADALVRAGDVGVAERERRVEVVQRVGVRVQRGGVLGGERGTARPPPRVVAGEAQVLGDERGALAGAGAAHSAAATRRCSSRRRARLVSA